MNAPVLIFGYGNISRGDDALAPLLLTYIENNLADYLNNVELLTDFQLQVEHALDLTQRELVLFIDACVADIEAIAFQALSPARDNSYSTHAMSPQAVLFVYQTLTSSPPPPCFLLSIKGEQFVLGADLSSNASVHLQVACQFIEQLLKQPHVNIWQGLCYSQ